MRVLPIILFLFAMPITALSQTFSQLVYCFDSHETASSLRSIYDAACSNQSGRITLWGVVQTGEQWCIQAHCSSCGTFYENVKSECCIQEKAPKPQNYFQCIDQPYSGPGLSEAKPINLSSNPLDWCDQNASRSCMDSSSSSGNEGTSSSSGGSEPSSSSFVFAEYCADTASDLIELRVELEKECSGESTYEIEAVEGSAYYRFCITGGCEYDSGSSSSEGDGGYSSDSEGSHFDLSCKIGDYYWNYMSKYAAFHRTLYPSLPYMLKKNQMYVSGCGCSGNDIVYCQTRNFGYVHNYIPSSLKLCGYSHGYWCEGIESGGANCDFSGKSEYIYHADGYGWLAPSHNDNNLYILGGQSSYFGVTHKSDTLETWTEQFFTLGFTLPSNVSTSDLEATILSAFPDFPSLDKMHAYCRGEWIPHDDNCFGTQSEAYEAMEDSTLFCSLPGGIPDYGISLSNRGWCVEGGCEFKDVASSSSAESPSFSSSSGGEGEYGGNCRATSDEMVPVMTQAILDCKGEHNYSISYFGTNPDGKRYCLVGGCSVNTYASSSSINSGEGISSSGSGCSPYPLSSTPANPLNACFSIGGKCYKCNLDRGSECGSGWLWSSGFSDGNVGWWYREVACDGGSIGNSSSSGESGGCRYNVRGADAVYTAADCFNGGLDNMKPGKCYSLNPSLGTQYGWISNDASDGWWWVERSCGGEEDKKCSPAGLAQLRGTEFNEFLQKKSVSEEFWEEVSKGNTIIKSGSLYDASGRRTYDDRKTRRFLFNKSYYNVYNGTEPLILLMKKNPVIFRNGTVCGELGEDYGRAKVGGITCSEVEAVLENSDILVEQKHLGCREEDNSPLEELSGKIIVSMKLRYNEIFYVEAGYVYPDSKETVTKEQENAIRLHELGHQSDNSRIVANGNRITIPVSMKIVGNKDIVEKEWELWWKNQLSLLVQEYEQKIKEATIIYHNKYGDTGHP